MGSLNSFLQRKSDSYKQVVATADCTAYLMHFISTAYYNLNICSDILDRIISYVAG